MTRALGRGLGSLIPENKENEGKTIEKVPLEKIKPRSDQPRKDFDEKSIENLAASLDKYGLLSPIVLQKDGDGYLIVAGERRFRAAKLLGWKEIDCLIKDLDKEKLDLVSLVENIQREDLSALEEAASYDKLIKTYKLTQEDLAEKLGKSRSYIANTLRLLKLDEKSRKELAEGNISQSQARSLLSIDDLQKREEILEDFKNKKTNIRKVEKESKTQKRKNIKAKQPDDEEILDKILIEDYEEKLMDQVGSKVKIDKNGSCFKVTIDCFSIDDIEDLFRRLSNGSND